MLGCLVWLAELVWRQESFRRPFGRALQYFQLMLRRSEDLSSNVIRRYGGVADSGVPWEAHGVQEAAAPLEGLVAVADGAGGREEGSLANLSASVVENLAQDRVATSYFAGENDHRPSLDGMHPSPFLRARCPLCFGADRASSSPEA
jgi:hypothetical protein